MPRQGADEDCAEREGASARFPCGLDVARLERLESALREGRIEEFRADAESLEAALDADELRESFLRNPDAARKLAARSQRLGTVLGYVAAVTQAMAAIGAEQPDAYGPGGGQRSPEKRKRLRVEA